MTKKFIVFIKDCSVSTVLDYLDDPVNFDVEIKYNEGDLRKEEHLIRLFSSYGLIFKHSLLPNIYLDIQDLSIFSTLQIGFVMLDDDQLELVDLLLTTYSFIDSIEEESDEYPYISYSNNELYIDLNCQISSLLYIDNVIKTKKLNIRELYISNGVLLTSGELFEYDSLSLESNIKLNLNTIEIIGNIQLDKVTNFNTIDTVFDGNILISESMASININQESESNYIQDLNKSINIMSYANDTHVHELSAITFKSISLENLKIDKLSTYSTSGSISIALRRSNVKRLKSGNVNIIKLVLIDSKVKLRRLTDSQNLVVVNNANLFNSELITNLDTHIGNVLKSNKESLITFDDLDYANLKNKLDDLTKFCNNLSENTLFSILRQISPENGNYLYRKWNLENRYIFYKEIIDINYINIFAITCGYLCLMSIFVGTYIVSSKNITWGSLFDILDLICFSLPSTYITVHKFFDNLVYAVRCLFISSIAYYLYINVLKDKTSNLKTMYHTPTKKEE